MEMKVKGSFYMLQRKDKDDNIILFNDLAEAVKRISEFLKSGVPAEQIDLTKIDVEQDKIKATGVPWSVIAEKLVALS